MMFRMVQKLRDTLKEKKKLESAQDLVRTPWKKFTNSYCLKRMSRLSALFLSFLFFFFFFFLRLLLLILAPARSRWEIQAYCLLCSQGTAAKPRPHSQCRPRATETTHPTTTNQLLRIHMYMLHVNMKADLWSPVSNSIKCPSIYTPYAAIADDLRWSIYVIKIMSP